MRAGPSSRAAWVEAWRFTSRATDETKVARYVKAGCRRYQVGDTETRLLFEPALLGTIARMIYANTRRSSDSAAHPVGRGQFAKAI